MNPKSLSEREGPFLRLQIQPRYGHPEEIRANPPPEIDDHEMGLSEVIWADFWSKMKCKTDPIDLDRFWGHPAGRKHRKSYNTHFFDEHTPHHRSRQAESDAPPQSGTAGSSRIRRCKASAKAAGDPPAL